MKLHVGGSHVERGGYWSFTNGSYARIPEGGGTLPGGDKVKYIRAPLPLIFLGAPILGLTFVIFLPFVGFGMVLYVLGKALRVALEGFAESVVRVAAPNWAPGRAYFARRRENRAHKKSQRR
jgi:hypothetical protein